MRSVGCGGPTWLPCSPHEVIKGLLKRGVPGGLLTSRLGGRVHAIDRKLLAKEWEPTTDGVNFAAIVCEVDKHLADEATVTLTPAIWQLRPSLYRLPAGAGVPVVGGRRMGSGMPMAVAATLRRPGKQVVAFLGDGGALMMGNEIATACQYGGNPIMIISDNGMYGTIGMHSSVRYPERPFMDGTR